MQWLYRLCEADHAMSETLKEKALKEGVPIIKDEGLAFLLNLIRERNCKEILELGTAVGYSSIQMALLDKNIHIDTLEKIKDMYTQALDNIKASNVEKQIEVFFMWIILNLRILEIL